ncbi:hypothetical protein BD779DRAFT_1432389, partial [Infundibulicybe gibba]
PAPTAAPPLPQPSPAQLESLYAAASSGDLSLLKRLFRNALEASDAQPFALANDASSRTGLTALHAAASRGYLDIVTWLIQDCGAMPDIEDKEGEGYLDIVRWLCEHGGAADLVNSVKGVDVRSKDGWTPLMNAASKGHLPVVLYLLTKQSANPLIRNNWGETAYDAAAAVFEVWICEVLQQTEAEQWRGTTMPYNPLAVHMTIPLILYENQRLDTRLKTVAVSGGKPKFSASGLGKHGRRSPFELKLPQPGGESEGRLLPAWRSGVQLPLLNSPWILPTVDANERSLPDGSERSHFWLSDWTLDVTHPGVDAQEGWQYGHRFDEPDEKWTAEQPPQLQRILTGVGAVTAGLGGSTSGGSGRSNSMSSAGSSRPPHTWVRRRRWVRIMRRRLDIPPLPFSEPDGGMYHLDVTGTLVPHFEDHQLDQDDGEGQELGSMPTTTFSSQDYVARARYLVGTQRDASTTSITVSAVEARRAIAKLERATTELRQGILSDEDSERKTQAEVLLKTYSRDLERRRLAAGAQGLLISGGGDEVEQDDDYISDDEFHYPGSSSTDPPHLASSSSSSTDYFGRPASRLAHDLTPQLSQAPDFRVPTHEAPQKNLMSRISHTPYQVHAQWERDEAVHGCRSCQRRFNFLNRRVRHCRRCGRIFCDRCSSQRALLDPVDIVHDPAFPESTTISSSQRVCQTCYDEVNVTLPSALHGTRSVSMERIVVDQGRLTVPGHLSRIQSSSQLSDLAECPVCNRSLEEVGTVSEQEAHVKSCLDGGSGATPQAAKYLVYRLPAESVLIGVECVICLEEFSKGSNVARLSCFCSFHNGLFYTLQYITLINTITPRLLILLASTWKELSSACTLAAPDHRTRIDLFNGYL